MTANSRLAPLLPSLGAGLAVPALAAPEAVLCLECGITLPRGWLVGAAVVAGILLLLGALIVARLRRAERRAAAQERIDLATLEVLGEAVFDLDGHGQALGLRGDVERIVGSRVPATAEALVSRIHEDDRSRTEGILRDSVAHAKPFATEFRLLHSDGTWRWVKARGAPVHDHAAGGPAVVGVLQDVTEDHRIADEHRTLAERLDGTIENISDGFMLLDGDLRFLRVNAQCERWLGTSREAMLGRPLHEVFVTPPEDSFAEGCLRVLSEGGMAQVLEHYLPWDRWYDNRIHRVPEGVAVFFRDVTEERLAQQEREALATRLRDLVESIRDGFVALDRELRYTYVNATAERLLGLTEQQLLGRDLTTAFPGVAGTAFYAACQRVLHSGAAERVEEFYPPHGRWYRDHVYSTADGLALFFEDITDAKRLEGQLTAERRRFQALFDQTGAGIVELSLDDGRVIAANARFSHLLGRRLDELVGSAIGTFVHPDDRAGELVRLDQLRRGAVQEIASEKRYLRPDGSVVWVSLTSSVVRLDGDRPPYVLSILHDVTDRRRATVALVRSEQRLAVYSRELARAVENERARIAREIHDELGQALTGLKLDIAWVSRRIEARDTAGGLDPLGERLEDIQLHLAETVQTVRRIATDLRPAALDELGLGPALRAHVGEFARRAGLEAEVDVQDVAVTGDAATALFRIAQEALTNVARHAEARHVSVSLGAQGPDAVLEVTDDGTGTIPDAEGHGASATAGHGLLGIVERARLAGGSARITSRKGHGTTVRARVPCATHGGRQ